MRPLFIGAASMAVCMVAAGTQCRAEGNVLAYLGPDAFGQNTVLTIEGDHLGNEIRVVEDAIDHVRIEGLNGTTVNGLAADEVFASLDIFPGAFVDLGNGDDSVEYVFTGGQFNHLLQITTGNGDDEATIVASGFVGSLRIDTGTGNDVATVQFAGDALVPWLFLDTGVGDDAVFIEADNSGFPILFNLGVIETGQGNDVAAFDGWVAALSGSLIVFLDEGDDTLLGDPDSEVPVPGRVEALGGSGHDTVLNAAYFRSPFALHQFETIVE